MMKKELNKERDEERQKKGKKEKKTELQKKKQNLDKTRYIQCQVVSRVHFAFERALFTKHKHRDNGLSCKTTTHPTSAYPSNTDMDLDMGIERNKQSHIELYLHCLPSSYFCFTLAHFAFFPTIFHLSTVFILILIFFSDFHFIFFFSPCFGQTSSFIQMEKKLKYKQRQRRLVCHKYLEKFLYSHTHTLHPQQQSNIAFVIYWILLLLLRSSLFLVCPSTWWKLFV